VLKKKLNELWRRASGKELKETGKKEGKRLARSKLNKKVLGGAMLAELQTLKDDAGENCPKCKRTRRKYCRKHQRMLKGLDHLAGQIAKKYVDKKSKWKENMD